MLIFYGAAIVAEFIRFCRRSQNRPGVRARLGGYVRKYMGTGTRTRRFIKYGFLLYLIAGIGVSCVSVVYCAMYIFQLRAWVDRSQWIALDNGSNPENDATSFGQLVPIFLSALILFTFLQTISGKCPPCQPLVECLFLVCSFGVLMLSVPSHREDHGPR